MEVFSIVWQFLCLWGGIYTSVFILKYSFSRSVSTHKQMVVAKNTTLLPSHTVDTDQLEGVLEQNDEIAKTGAGDQLQDEWRIMLFQVRFTTRRLNPMFERLARLCPTFWHWWFSIGVVMAGLLMVVDILVMIVAAFKTVVLLYATTGMNRQQLQQWTNRDLGYEYMDKQNEVPELTLSLAHVGYYISALLLCGVIHEAGHAIATFSERVPMQNCGISFYYIYPGAFVNISDQYLQLLSPFRQLKIICAGTLHNLVFYGFTVCMLSGGLKSILEWSGWQTLEGNGGVSIVQVSSQSPMVPHLPVSSIIYQLDDTELEHNRIDWDNFLLDPQGREQPHLGFCALVNETPPNTLACCEIDDQYPFGKALNVSMSCFRDFDSTMTEKVPDHLMCLSTIQVLGPRHPERCENDAECSGQGMKCVTPYTPSKNGQVVRIYARMPDWMYLREDQDKVFVFEGDLVDIWDSVMVGILQPKYWFLPATFPHRFELLLRYTSSFTLALAMLNILPAFKLDGYYASLQFLALVFQRTLNTSMNITRRIHGFLVKAISYLGGFIIMASIVVGIFW